MKEIQNIKNIIFDLGGVILNIDYSLTIEAIKNLGISDFDNLFSQASQSKLFDRYEIGRISSEEFRKEINSLSKKSFTDFAIDTAWNTMLLDLPKQRLELLVKLKKSYRTFLLSNANEIHISCVNKYLNKKYGINDLSNYFEKIYFSYKVGLRKPNLEIFNLILKENNLNPTETLFIDDSIQHIEVAEKLGINTHWLDVKKETVLNYFLTEFD